VATASVGQTCGGNARDRAARSQGTSIGKPVDEIKKSNGTGKGKN